MGWGLTTCVWCLVSLSIPETLKSTGGLPPEICNVFGDPVSWQQVGSRHYVFDRRTHAVFIVPTSGGPPTKLVDIGPEDGRLLTPTAFSAAPDGSFAVADAPGGQQRLQVFDRSGKWLSGFFLPGRVQVRVTLGNVAVGGGSTLAYSGNRLAVNQPESDALITEYSQKGAPLRSIGRLRETGFESDKQLHWALNTGLPLRHPDGGYVFVFLTGRPMFRRYDAKGQFVFERLMQGRELDPVLEQLPTAWPRRSVDGTELPLVTPTVRTATLDPARNLWVSFVTPFTYVFDDHGEKIRTVQFVGAGVVAPNSLSFDSSQSVLVTPGCFEFSTK